MEIAKDYLAAKQWVESGEIARATSNPWTARTAYAACIISDATEVLRTALASPSGLPTAAEIISNLGRLLGDENGMDRGITGFSMC